MRLKRAGKVLVVAGILMLAAGAAFRLWHEFQVQKIKAAARAAALVAQAESMEAARRSRIAELFMAGNPKLDRETAEFYSDCVEEAAERYEISPEILAGLIYVESRGNAWAKNKDCLGLTQVRWKVWGTVLKANHPEIYERRDLFNPRKSILAGAWVLRHYLNRFKEADEALLHYSGMKKDYPDAVLTVARSL